MECRGARMGDAIGRDLRAGLAVTDLEVDPGYAAALALDGGWIGRVTRRESDWVAPV